MTVARAIQHYLRTGESDMLGAPWPGRNTMESARRADSALRDALVAEVARRSRRRKIPGQVAGVELERLTLEKVEPMVSGLFPRREQGPVLGALGRSLVFLTPENIAAVLRDAGFLHTAWALANLYLGSLGAELLGEDAPRIVGMSVETTCYVSLSYFDERDRFADYVVHEAAHVFHDCKRETLGLSSTRTREWLLSIDFRERETFAYACEAYSRICSLARRPADRRSLVEEHAARSTLPDEAVPVDEYLDILREAVQARNGWKRILARCAAPPSKSMAQRAREAHAARVEAVRAAWSEAGRSS